MDSKTRKNLEKAFQAEALAHMRYLIYAEKAEREPMPEIARILRAAAEGERIHAMLILNQLGIKDTADNLAEALAKEGEEYDLTYLEMKKDAEEENEDGAATVFDWARKVEGEHRGYLEDIQGVRASIEDNDIYVCQGCGHIAIGTPPETCPICGAPIESFTLV